MEGDNTQESDIAQALRESRTQFNTEKVAQQTVVWAIDPSTPLNRQRQLWRSNGTLFDSSLFVNGDGETEVNLTATGTDSARIKSAFVGQYISHVLSEPGLALSIADSNVQIDANNEISLDHGLVQFGPFFHDGTDITDGFGLELDTNGMRFRAVAGGNDVGDSPISQSSWNVNRVHGDEDFLDLSLQSIFNFGYGFYNALPLTASRIKVQDKSEDRRSKQQILHSENPGADPLLHTPNLPVQLFASNEGTAQTLNVRVGGMQYARYGEEEPEFRTSTDYRQTTGGTFDAAEADTPDPSNESGDPIIAYQRRTGHEDLTLRDREIIIDPDADLYIYIWDEWDAGTALDGTFGQPDGVTNPDETLVQTSTDSTTYTPTISNFRGSKRASAGQNNRLDPTTETVDDRVPLEATRVVTAAASDGSASFDINYLEFEWEETY